LEQIASEKKVAADILAGEAGIATCDAMLAQREAADARCVAM